MTPDRTRLARRLLLGTLVVVSGAVAWSLRRPAVRPGRGEGQAAPAPGQGTTLGEMSVLRFQAGERKVEIRARSAGGKEGEATRFLGVEVRMPYVSEGGPSNVTITADECLYQAEPVRASFRGQVHVKTDDGFELWSETLKYWGDEDRVFSRDDVRFERGTTSGTAHGMEYRGGYGLDLQQNVRLHLEDEAGPPTDIEAAAAHASRDDHEVQFWGSVVVRQGGRELRSDRLQLNLSADMHSVERAAAIENVDLVAAPGAGLTGAAPGAAPAVEQGGRKRLRCRRLNVAFRAKGVLQEAIAVNSASLEIEPSPREVQERRRVAAPQLRFDFDEQGRLVSLQGLPARQTDPAAPRQAILTAEPLAPAEGGLRRVQSDTFLAAFDPESGAVRGATFDGAVTASEPGRRAWAARGTYDDGSGLVTLTGDPRIVDEDGSELRGRRILIGSRSHDVKASENVRHTMASKGGRGPQGSSPGGAGPKGMLQGEEPTVLFCREFDYDESTRTARYRENAVLRSGTDELRAPTIVLEERAEGRRLTASGGTTSILHPRPGNDAAKEPQKEPAKPPVPIEARSREMVYEEAANRIVYKGEVEIRQGDILSKSPEAVVTLNASGDAVERMVAGEPVEVTQGARRATGQKGTYTPDDQTLVLVGDKVVLYDTDRQLDGRIVTFVVGSDRIRVDGREEVRSEAVLRRKEPPKP